MPIRRESPETAFEAETYNVAERIVLGGILSTQGTILDDVRVIGGDFRSPKHEQWFDAMRAEFWAGRPVTSLALAERFPDDAPAIWALTDEAIGQSRESLIFHSERVRARGMFTRVWVATEGIRNMGLEDLDADGILDLARDALERQVGVQKIQARRLDEIYDTVVENITAPDGLYIPSPWPSLDRVIGGLRPGAVYVVAARPAVGKSVIAAQLAQAMAGHGTCAFASLEMSGEEIVARYMASTLQINLAKITNNALTEFDLDKIRGRRAEVANLDIRVDDRAAVGVSEIASFARGVARNGKLSGIVVDYLQLMTARNGARDRHEIVGEFSRMLKVLAKELQVPVVALSQLNRKVEDRAEPIPKISDLRESGSIEQDADVVILLRREGEMPNERIILDVAKNRHGKPGEVELDWQGIYSRAVDLMWHPDEEVA